MNPEVSIDVRNQDGVVDAIALMENLHTRGYYPVMFHRDTDGIVRIAAGGFHRADASLPDWRSGLTVAVNEAFGRACEAPFHGWFSIFFDPAASSHAHWKDFPPCSVIIPRIFFTQHDAFHSVQFAGTAEERGRMSLAWDSLSAAVKPNHDLPASLRCTVAWDDSLYAETVQHALDIIHRNGAEKIVTAREVLLNADRPMNPSSVLRHLLESQKDSHIILVSVNAATHFICASPERLVRVQDRLLSTAAIAGTVPRGDTKEEERCNEIDLFANRKLAEEQHFVVRMIHDSLIPISAELRIHRREVLRLPQLMHFQSRIQARLAEGCSLVDAVLALHPTPAVAGTPRDAACSALGAIESFDRGLYAGVFGWMDSGGNGEGIVTIRAALIHGNTARLYAGAGIVDLSFPEDEVSETRLKLHSMITALEHG